VAEGEFSSLLKSLERRHAVYAAVSVFMLLGFWLRYLPEQGMQYFQALDPYFIYSMSQHLVFEGAIPVTDFTRYFPYNTPSYTFQFGNIAIPAVLYLLGPQLFMPFLEWAQMYPAVMAAFSILAMFLFGREMRDDLTGLASAFFVAVAAGTMQRTSAGFFEKEPTAIPFMIFSVFGFARAWRNRDWRFGVVSGLSLGVATASWGGSSFLWLLFPLSVGTVFLLDEDIRGLVAAYTPTVLVGGFLGFVANPSRFSLSSSFFLGNLALLALLWVRYSAEELELVSENRLPYLAPSAAVSAVVLAALSPLYSDFLASRVTSLYSKAVQSGGGVVAGTVAENQAASLSQFVGQLSAATAGSGLSTLLPPQLSGFAQVAGLVGGGFGPLALAFASVVFMGASVGAAVLRRLDVVGDTLSELSYHQLVGGVLLVWTLVFAASFQDNVLFAAGPGVLLVLVSSAALYLGDELGANFEVRRDFSLVLGLFFVVSVVLGAAAKSRLLFLAAFPVSFGAGYAVSLAWGRAKSLSRGASEFAAGASGVLALDVLILGIALSAGGSLLLVVTGLLVLNAAIYFLLDSDRADEVVNIRRPAKFAAVVAAVVLAVANFGAGYGAVSGVGGSPNSLWEENLDYQRSELDGGDVVMSWWDYGYWFQNIGERAAVADGGNLGYYASGEKINYPLADVLTSTNASEQTRFLEKHSVDYIVLDETMIGKYSAVSQIANRDNSDFQSMLQVGASSGRRALSGSENDTVLTLSRGNFRLFVPVNASRSGVEVSGAPTLEAGGRRGRIDCLLTEDGERQFNVTPLQFQGRFLGVEQPELCVAENPFYNLDRGIGAGARTRMVLVPKMMKDHMLVDLYLQDGGEIPFVEKVSEGSNGYVKMWKVQDRDE
jgi:asparagine N-glycosylation enzyme membrane subunit Stt3